MTGALPYRLLSSFSHPAFNRTIWLNGFQHYLAGHVGDEVFVTTDKVHARFKRHVLCVSKSGLAFYIDDQGNRTSKMPFPLPEDQRAILAAIPDGPLPTERISLVDNLGGGLFDALLKRYGGLIPVYTDVDAEDGVLEHGGDWSPEVPYAFCNVVHLLTHDVVRQEDFDCGGYPEPKHEIKPKLAMVIRRPR